MANYKLLLPKMGESVAEATIIKWLKKPGDHIEADEAVIEIATDKVDSEVPSPVSGKLVERLCNEDDVIQVGTVIAVIETEVAEEVPATQPGVPVPPAYESPKPVIEEAVPQPEEPTHATAQENHEEPKEETVADEILKPEIPQPEAEAFELNEQEIPGIAALQEQPVTQSDNFKTATRFYSPLVKNIALQEGIGQDELDKVEGTGADGRLTKDDLLNYIQDKYVKHAEPAVASALVPEEELPVTESSRPSIVIEQPKQPVKSNGAAAAAPSPAIAAAQPVPSPKPNSSISGGDEILEMDRMRRLIAEHMVMSKHTSPHVTSFVEADVTNLVLWRDKIKNSFEKREGEKITFTPIFIEAVVKAIRDFPMINVSVSGTQIIKKKNINISMATALPSGNLIVPVIKHADDLSLLGLIKAVNDLANRARNNKLQPDDVKEGTFTITNVGSFGNIMGTPIINQPQVAILAVGAIKKKPAVIETPQGDFIGIRHMMFLSLSYDHRVVDGALGGSFVRRIADYLEKWDSSRSI